MTTEPKFIRHIKFFPGKPPARIDNRTLKMMRILKTELLPPLPLEFNVDSAYPTLNDTDMFGNDAKGDCVIAQHAHQEYRFQFYQLGKKIAITTSDVLTEYFRQTGGGDTGLDMLTSLNVWRQTGFLIGGQIYKIHAFATVDVKNHNEVMYGTMLFNGVAFGMSVPQSAMDQHNQGLPWTVVVNDGGILGGHAVYKFRWIKIVSLNVIGPVCVTWGSEQQMTWEFWDKYVDEAYVIIDERDSWIAPTDPTDPLNIPVLEQYLIDIGSTPSQQMTITTLSVPKAKINKPYSAALGVAGGVPPYTWTMSSGVLPPGLVFTSSGVISGTPTKVGNFKGIYMVSDTAGNGTGVILTVAVKKKCIF